jgi:hypothetical protein
MYLIIEVVGLRQNELVAVSGDYKHGLPLGEMKEFR